MRGNQSPEGQQRRRVPINGSIPACAGEPMLSAVGPGVGLGLSPRVRGNLRETVLRRRTLALHGLSPRVRGNRYTGDRPASVPIIGSIPACAGEPRICVLTCGFQVYGLSPRVRGNHRPPQMVINRRQGVYPRVCGGTSVPARLGTNDADKSVYPRVCGGTSNAGSSAAEIGGL